MLRARGALDKGRYVCARRREGEPAEYRNLQRRWDHFQHFAKEKSLPPFLTPGTKAFALRGITLIPRRASAWLGTPLIPTRIEGQEGSTTMLHEPGLEGSSALS